MSKLALTEDQVMSALNKCYEAALNGLPNTPNCYEIAEQYLNKYGDAEKSYRCFCEMANYEMFHIRIYNKSWRNINSSGGDSC